MSQASSNADPAKQFKKHLQHNLPIIRSLLFADLRSSTIFLIPHSQSDLESQSEAEALRQQMSSRFQVRMKQFTPTDPPLSGSAVQLPSGLVVSALTFTAVAGDIAKEAIQSWYRHRHPQPAGQAPKVQLRDHGLLLPRICDITCHSFPHGIGHYYRFRIAKHNIDSAPKPLADYLLTLPSRCPNEYFLSGPRASHCTGEFQVWPAHCTNHAVTALARAALAARKYKSAHEDVQKFMLENDLQTIASEVPIWLEPAEMPLLGLNPVSGQTLTGHIDVIRAEGDTIAIWDFKPNAASETSAGLQVFLYALLLSTRTGVPIQNFRCGYFDDHDAFEFMASQVGTPPNISHPSLTTATY